MDTSELIAALNGTLTRLLTGAAIKTTGGIVFAALGYLHTQLLFCFVFLVLLDLLTKWISLSRRRIMLLKSTKKPPTLWDCICGLKKARRAGYIRSSEMKHRFLGKMIVYMIIALAGAAFDCMMAALNKPQWAVFLLIGYLATTEVLSIIENLQDSGVEAATDLHEIVEKKIEQLKK